MTLAIDLPMHLYGYVDRRFCSDGQREGWEPAVLFGLTCPANRAFGLTVLLECGALYRELPAHAWAFTEDAAPWTMQQAQAWDCFGGTAEAIEYAYLRELPIKLLKSGLTGSYLCSIEFGDNGFSRYPAQSKTLHALELDNGRLTFQPGDAMRWHESSFTRPDGDVSWLRRQESAWGAEGWPA